MIVDIYYGTDVVKLISVPGDTVQFTPGQITNPATEVCHSTSAVNKLVLNVHGQNGIMLI